jgi:hypothetical protein
MNKTTTPALVLIALALVGAGVSYHFTLQTRLTLLEQKLDENSLALQQYQIAQETAASSKTDALDNLSREVDSLQSSLAPLGKTTQQQTDSLAELRKQIAALQQSQQAEQDQQKKLADYAGQLDTIKHAIAAQTVPPQVAIPPVSTPIPTPAPAPVPAAKPASTAETEMTPAQVAPMALPVALPVIAPRAMPVTPLPVAPRADNAIDLRPDDSAHAEGIASVRALPVVDPVTLSENR